MCTKGGFPVIEMYRLLHVAKTEIFARRLSEYLPHHVFMTLPHKHDFYQILLFTKGTGNGHIDSSHFEICPFRIFFLAPGQVRVWNFSDDTEGYVINFSSCFFKTFLLNPQYVQQFACFSGRLENAAFQLPSILRQEVNGLFQRVTEEMERNENMSSDMIKVMMVQLFINISRLTVENKSETAVTSFQYAIIKKFLDLVEKNVSILKLPSEYARLLFVTPHHLNTVCNIYLGRSTGEVIRQRMILEAQRLMFNMDLSIAEIAYKLDFSDYSYFSKFFKKYTGQAPEKFRKSLAGNSFANISDSI